MANARKVARSNRLGALVTEQLRFARRFARDHGITVSQAKALMNLLGLDLAALTTAAQKLKTVIPG